MLKNFWWALAFSAEITRQPQQRRALDQFFVMYRQADGGLVILHDRCPFCGEFLSKGKVAGDLITCQRDGAMIQPDGRVARGPQGAAIPEGGAPRFVDAYPGEDRYGWVFAFLGDLPESERFPIPDLPYFDDPQYKRIDGKFEWNVHYARALENGVDAAHTPFVHGGAFGNPDEPEIEEYEAELFERSARATIYMTPQPSKGIWRLLYKAKKEPVKTVVQWWLPNLSLLEVHIPLGTLIIFNAHVPVDELKTVSHYIALRTFFTGNWADKDSHRRVVKIFDQDKSVVEAQRPELLPFDLAAELHVRSDAVQIAFRKERQPFKELGWSIAGSLRGPDFVIPSPIRRELVGVDNLDPARLPNFSMV